jgi:hypothetical protein
MNIILSSNGFNYQLLVKVSSVSIDDTVRTNLGELVAKLDLFNFKIK